MTLSMTTTVVDLAPAAIAASPFNHRTKFTGIDELAASILEKGLIAPVTVRPREHSSMDKVHYELVVGERRWRAAKKAKIEVIPAIVRELTDKEVIEVQLIENVQRVDVHPLEEADGYRELLDKHGYDIEQIVSKTGKSRTAVYNRLKLCKLSTAARAAFLEDKINASIAELVARIPVPKLQDSAIKEIIGGRDTDFWNLGDDEEAHDAGGKGIYHSGTESLPLSVREAQVLLQRRYMLRLECAPFPIADAELVRKVGACTTCVYRTGNQVELFADVPSPDVCTNPPCYESKRIAHWERSAADAKTKGLRVLSDKEATEVFRAHDPTRLSHNAPFVDLKGEADWQFQPDGGGKAKTWGQILGKDVQATVVAQDGTGAARELVERDAAMQALKLAGKLKPESRRTSRDAYVDKARKASEERRRTNSAVLEVLADKALSDKAASAAWWRWLAEATIRQASMEAQAGVCARRGIPKLKGKLGDGARACTEKPLLALAKTLEIETARALVTEMLAAESAFTSYGVADNMHAAARVLGVDVAKVKMAANAAAKAAKKAKARKS